MKPTPLIDLFAGPGGLGEGFSARADRFELKLSLEMDPIACATLRLRHFFHLSAGTSARDSYYAYVQGNIGEEEFVRSNRELWELAQHRVMNVELGDRTKRSSVHRRIRSEIAGQDFVLIGGPPCQAYSVIGRSRRLGLGVKPSDSNLSRTRRKLQSAFYSDPRHQLYREYLEIIAVHRPVAFVMENVKGLTSARANAEDFSGSMFNSIRSDLENPGDALRSSISEELVHEFGPVEPTRYRLVALSGSESLFREASNKASDFIVRCEEYGVPQARHRIIIVGVREDVGELPKALSAQAAASARDMISGLPRLRSSVSREAGDWFGAISSNLWRIPLKLQIDLNVPSLMRTIRANSVKLDTGGDWVSKPATVPADASEALRWVSDDRLHGVLQHRSRSHMASDLVRYLYCAAFAARFGRSPSLREWPASLRPEHRNVRSVRGKLRPSGFADRFKVQGAASQSSTITSHISKDGHYYIHYDPSQCRSLTVREAARLQSFPDNYFFCGNRTQQYHQVGNAVPPFLAKQIADSLAEVLIRRSEMFSGASSRQTHRASRTPIL